MKNKYSKESKAFKTAEFKVTAILLLFLVAVAVGLCAVDFNFNRIVANPEKISIVNIERNTQDIYKVRLLGKHKTIDVGLYKRVFLRAEKLAVDGVNSVRDMLDVFLQQAKKCSTIK